MRKRLILPLLSSLVMLLPLQTHATENITSTNEKNPIAIKEKKSTVIKQGLTEYVNPFVGTDFTGHTYPGATYPFGMIQLSPDTGLSGWEVCSGYHYSHSEIYGFSHTHLDGTGCEDYCDILVMPVIDYTGEINGEKYKSSFKHQNEEASPGYYKVLLDNHNITAELTTGKRSGLHRYTFPKGVDPQIIIDLTHRDPLLDANITKINGNTIQGYRVSNSWATNQHIFFHLETSLNISDSRIETSLDSDGNTINSKLILTFKKRSKNELIVKVGISSVSSSNAEMNLKSEVEKWEFDKIRSQARAAWEDYLSKIEVSTENIEDKKIFYTAMYHTAVAPNLYSDVNGEYRGMDRKIHKAEGYNHYTVFSLWDTYRALHPLFTLIEQEKSKDFILSFLDKYDQSGKLPIWELACNETDCMIGYHSISVIADAFSKGLIDDIDKERLLEAMITSADKNEYGKDVYISSGYVAAEREHESISKTLEYAYDDWCIAMLAKSMGRQDVYREFIKRAQSYKNILDPETGFMRPKLWGQWINPFSPTDVNNHFTEANSWQYSFYVPQDLETHIEMLGGDEAYTKKLDEMFNSSNQTTGRTQADITGLIGQYAHGNEPSHHAAYLYAYTGEHFRGEEIIREILNTLYSSAPDGLCGNDDCGQMSAWYIFSAMGFYPVLPGSDEYIIGSPIFDKVAINLENGNKFVITTTPGNSSENMLYINSVMLNGKNHPFSYIKHNEINNGGTLHFELSEDPNYSYARSKELRPVSRISDELIVINPYIQADNFMFKDSVTIDICSIEPTYQTFYKIIPGTVPDDKQKEDISSYTLYSKPITIKDNSVIYSFSKDEDGKRSRIITSRFNTINSEYKIQILRRYSRQYTAGGDEGLIDGVRGELNFRLGGWQGYQNTDFEAIVDLGKIKEINEAGAGFHQHARSWIWMPRYVDVYISEDGERYTHLGRIENDVDEKDFEAQNKDFTIKDLNVKARYVKIFAKNYGTIPYWHPGAGGEGFIFVDEILVK